MSDFKETFEHQAEWRREQAAELREAAVIFDLLAATVADVPPEVLAAAEELFGDTSDTEVEQEMLRAVGFHAWPYNAEEFIREFIARRTS